MTANQLYKESGSTLKFTEWLTNQQEGGLLASKDEMSNASGGGKSEIKIGGINIKYIAIGAVALMAVGAYMYYSKNKS